MGNGNWDRVRLEFARLQDLAPQQRAAELELLAPEIKAELSTLLDAHARAGGFLEPGVDAPGGTIGPYRIIEEIGRGGMGVVYRAERVDGEFRRQVAIKVAGGRLFAPESERRFIRERQILARIEHPNIVRLLDGGMQNGQRYFVMELIEGAPITAYCNTRNLTVDERLRLFGDVCSALHYAHQRMILHRDLKPANIWVTADGVVKVLDFGIAQILNPDGPASDATRTGLNPVSLSAASPEQVRGEPLTFASDVYSLGLLLYELIAGINPQQAESLSVEKALRRVLEETPAAPSRIRNGLPRDLDAIVLKAVDKNPECRYGSALELAADIGRMRTGRPVLAVAPSRWYVLKRYVLRNRIPVVAAATVAIVASAAFANYVRQARLEQQRFEDARRLVRTVIFDIQPRMRDLPTAAPLRKTLIEETLRYLESVSRNAADDPRLLGELARAYVELGRVLSDAGSTHLGDPKTAAQHYRRAKILIDQALAASPSDGAVLADAAKVYTRLSYFTGSFDAQRSRDHVLHARKAVEFATRRKTANPGAADAMDDLASAHFAVGVSVLLSEPQNADDAFRIASDLYRQLVKNRPQSSELWRNLALCERYRSQIAVNQRRPADQALHAAAASAITAQILARNPDSQQAKLDAAIDAGMTASALWANGNKPAALLEYQRGVDIREALLKADPTSPMLRERLAIVTLNYCLALRNSNQIDKAEPVCVRALDLYSSLSRAGQLGRELRGHLADAYAQVGHVLRRRPAEACSLFAKAVPIFDQAAADGPLPAGHAYARESARREHESCLSRGLKPSGSASK